MILASLLDALGVLESKSVWVWLVQPKSQPPMSFADALIALEAVNRFSSPNKKKQQGILKTTAAGSVDCSSICYNIR